MKHLITLSLLAALSLAAPSCSTHVNSDTRVGVKKSKSSNTSVRADVGTSIGL